MKNRIGKVWKKLGIGRYLKSLRIRIFVITCLIGMIPIFLMKSNILSNYVEQTIEDRGTMLQNQCSSLVNRIGDAVVSNEFDLSAFETEMDSLAALYSGRLVVVNSDFRVVKDTYDLDEQKFMISREVIQCFQGKVSTSFDDISKYLEIAVPIRESVNRNIVGVLVISSRTEDISDSRILLSDKVFVLEIILIIAVFVAAFYTSSILVRPFAKVTESLEKINGGFLEDDLVILDYTETMDMSEAYNRMLGRMKTLDDSRSEFVSNVSHELKTPLTSMKVLADSLLMQEDVPVEFYKEFMTDIAEEIERENKIINDLLSLVKMDRKSQDIHIQQTNINELIDLILKRLRPIASQRNIELVLDRYKTVTADVDETKLTLALSNLIENAIKYNNENGWVHVSLNADHKYFYVKVEDNGIGIPQEDQEHIFERFYRVDKSHSREIGGTGLGLAITRGVIVMHHGVVKVFSENGEGTTFTVRIPLIYQE